MEPLKDQFFHPGIFRDLADALHALMPSLSIEKFSKELSQGNEDRELMERMHHTAEVLGAYLPDRFEEAVEIIEALAPHLTGFTGMVFPDFVEKYGMEHRDRSLEALKKLTVHSSAEFAIRPFLLQDMQGTLQELEKWTKDPNEHVRRLASEGTRPRLPWSFQLDAILKNPRLTQKILHALREDESLYVRKSVGNHLNDHSKDHADFVLSELNSWDLSNAHSAWIAKKAVRSLVKAGHPGSFGMMGFEAQPAYVIEGFSLKSDIVRLGSDLEFTFTLKSEKAQQQYLNVDYAIHYKKKSGAHSVKVFKLKEVHLNPGEPLTLSKRQKIEDFTTRKHYPGEHKIHLLINGVPSQEWTFELEA